MTLRSFVICE